MARETLTRGKVLDAALALAGTDGLAGLSMRRLAAELGVEAMSLYNHVANKGDLLDGITGRVFESIALPDPAGPWDQRLRALATAAAARFREHPVVVRALASGQANPRSVGALRLIDAILSALFDSGLDERAAAKAYRTLFGLLYGAALRDTVDPAGAEPQRAEPITTWFQRMVDAAEMPSLHRALPALMDTECSPAFADELELLISGLR